MYTAFYAQDQWTLKRFTAQRRAPLRPRDERLRRDVHRARSVRAAAVQRQRCYCVPAGDGVNYNDITPRWGAAWDVFGTGRTR